MHDVKDVVPEVVVFGDVTTEASFWFLVELKPCKVADETLVFLVVLHDVLFFSQLRKRVDDDTEQDVVKDNLHEQEERDVNCELEEILFGVLEVDLLGVVTDTATTDQTHVDDSQEALVHGLTPVLANMIWVIRANVIVVNCVLLVEEKHGRVNVHHDQHKAESHDELSPVRRDCIHHIAESRESLDHIEQMEWIEQLIAIET